MTTTRTRLTIQSFHQMASLVSVKLSNTNFLLWKSQVFPLIRSAQLLHHLEKEAPAMNLTEDGNKESNPDYEIWLNNDGLLMSWLLGTMNEEALSLVVGCDTANQIWRCLEEHYLVSSKEQELYLKGQLVTKREDNESLEDFIRKFKGVCDRLAAIRKPLDDLDKVFHLSRVVGTRFQSYNLAVLSKAPYPTFNQYIAGLQNNDRDLQVAEQESKDKTLADAQVFVAQRGRGQRGRGYGGRNFNSQGRGFVQAGNYDYNWSSNNKGTITNNNSTSQVMAQKDRFDHAYQSEELPQALTALTLMKDKDPNYYIDTGASDHMTSDSGKFYFKRPYYGNQKVLTGDGTPLNISHVGSTSVGALNLNNVLVVPELKKNLISVSKFTDENPCIFEFSSDGFVIKDQVTQVVLAKGTRKGQLYALEEGEKHALAAISNKATDSIWHQRLGHPNSNVRKALASKKNIVVSKWTQPPNLCSSCQMGKSCRLPFTKNNEKAESLFQKIHCDLWGPSPVQSTNHFAYYVIFVDDYSRFTWFYPLHRKSDFFDVFQKFQRMVANQFNKSIKIFQCDGGGEFSSKIFINHLATCGIKQQVSCPGTPEQNGVAERKHRHIVETGLTMLLHANMPPCYWVDSFSTAIFLINRMPTPTLQNKTPYFLLYGKIHDYSMIKVFGCRCFPYLRDHAAHKLQPRSLPCVFLGYSSIHKGYKCLHPPTKRIYISRHVVFDEHFLPYNDLTNVSSVFSTGGELCKYPNHDEWIQSFSHLQPSKLEEHVSMPSQHQHIINIDIDGPEDEPTNVNANATNILNEVFVEEQIKRDNTQSDIVHKTLTNNNAQTIDTPTLSSQEEAEPHQTNEVFNSEQSFSTSQQPHEGELRQDGMASSSSCEGIPPPPHSATSTSTHPMITRSRAGKHTGHIKTDFSKHAYTMTTDISSLSNADLDAKEPKTVRQALQLPQWVKAMQEELEALHKNNTWTLVPPPSSKENIVGSKWIFKTKLKPNGTVDRFKARLVAKGFSQIPGVNFDETSSPVLKSTTLRLVIAIATTLSWPLRQLDVKNAFLHGKLKEVVYRTQPPGFKDPSHPEYVCKLNKSIYGLKQAPRAWFDTFTFYLLTMGFCCSRANSSLFVLHKDHHTALLLLYVDDIVLTASSTTLLQHIVENLSEKFALKDLGSLSYFLGIEVEKFSGGIFLSQSKYANDVLTRASMLEASTIATPMAVKETTTLRDEEPVDPQEYRRIVGALQYLTITRVDIAHAVNKVCQFMQQPMIANFRQVKRILRYVKESLHHGLRFYSTSTFSLTGFCDVDWAGCPLTRRSTTGYCIFLGANCISWSSKKQPTIARSSAEAEYRALASTTAEIVWITYLFRDIGISLPHPPQLFSDNLSALHMSINPVFHAQTKHIELDYHFVREKVALGTLITRYIPSIDQIADILTKPLPRTQY
ncbi:hypothetical protein SLEP1_g36720 [Rubroshorea leprosula]|uniref:Integrase catalytic domain-containing protein n=1 Tax=Rubroshorea leprosula TaxID=152421 RepID=A0AAV5KSL3_9ROSI|nr:hypothetical protein SLEP1_g36720 [Rubroshorea leprosula]